MVTRTSKVSEASAAQTHLPAPTVSKRVTYGQGRQKLLAAAATLVAREGSSRLTLRDLAKEAGMSHNAIYRHFEGVDEMVQALISDLNQQLRDGLRQTRLKVPANEVSSRTVVAWLFDFALAHKDAFVVAVRERHGPSGPARQAIEQGMDLIMADMRADLLASQRLPPLPDNTLNLALKIIIQQTFELCLACIENPANRPALLLEAEQVFVWCLAGAAMSTRSTPAPPSPA
jgi:AcrR family transcriptional regulator